MAAAASATASSSNSAEQDALKALTFQRLHPRTYLERWLAENVRPDGRDFGEWRDISVIVGECATRLTKVEAKMWRRIDRTFRLVQGSISTADGSALVKLGSTTVVCGVKVEIAEPELDRPEDGFLGTSVLRTCSSLCIHLSRRHPVPNLDLPAICSPKFKPGPPTDEAQVLSDRLNEVLVTCVAIPDFVSCRRVMFTQIGCRTDVIAVH